MTNYLISSTGLEVPIYTLPSREPFILAADLAEAYGTETRAVVQALKRNPARFPEDFAFQLSESEMDHLKSQNVISNRANRDLPMAFTHAGAIALSGVLKTTIAAEVSVIVHRTFAAMEKRAFDLMRYQLIAAQLDTKARSARRVKVVDGTKAGLSFEAIWRMGAVSKAKLADLVHECMAMGLIDRLPAGTPVPTATLFDLFDGGTHG